MLHQRTHRRRYRDRPQRTPRRRVVALVVGAVGMLGLLIVGMVLSLASLLGIGSGGHSKAAPASRGTVQPAGQTPPERGSPESADEGRPVRGSTTAARVDPGDTGVPIILPAATTTGPSGVAPGYPRSAEGAIAQLAAIDVAIFGASVGQGRETLRAWSVAPSATEAAPALDVIPGLLRMAGGSDRAVPLMARIVASDTPARHDVCVAVAAWGHENARLGVHCARMTWDHGHWAMQPGRQTITGPNECQRTTSSPRRWTGVVLAGGQLVSLSAVS